MEALEPPGLPGWAWRPDLGPVAWAGLHSAATPGGGGGWGGGCGADGPALLSPAPVLRQAECSGLWWRSGELQGEGRRGLRGLPGGGT